jgi:hypothetical protein
MAMAALADGDGRVEDLSTEQVWAAAGIADRTYRRARQALLASGELVLVSGTGARGHRNVWIVRDPRRRDGAAPVRVARRVPRPAATRPLLNCCQDRTVATAKRPVRTGVPDRKSGQDRTVSARNGPGLTGVSGPMGGQDRTLFELPAGESPAERAAETPAETPAANARAGKEPQNPRIPEDPRAPFEGGTAPDSILVERTYITDRGRTRRRRVRVDLAEIRQGLGLPTAGTAPTGRAFALGSRMSSGRARSRSGLIRSS